MKSIVQLIVGLIIASSMVSCSVTPVGGPGGYYRQQVGYGGGYANQSFAPTGGGGQGQYLGRFREIYHNGKPTGKKVWIPAGKEAPEGFNDPSMPVNTATPIKASQAELNKFISDHR